MVLVTWFPAILMGLAGFQTITWWKDTGEGSPWWGLLMVVLCAGFLWIASRFNGRELAKAMETWIELFDKMLSFRLRIRARIRAMRIQIIRDERLYREFLMWKGGLVSKKQQVVNL